MLLRLLELETCQKQHDEEGILNSYFDMHNPAKYFMTFESIFLSPEWARKNASNNW